MDSASNHFESDISGKVSFLNFYLISQFNAQLKCTNLAFLASLNQRSSRERTPETYANTKTVEDTCASSIRSKNRVAWFHKMMDSKVEYDKAKAKLALEEDQEFIINSEKYSLAFQH